MMIIPKYQSEIGNAVGRNRNQAIGFPSLFPFPPDTGRRGGPKAKGTLVIQRRKNDG